MTINVDRVFDSSAAGAVTVAAEASAPPTLEGISAAELLLLHLLTQGHTNAEIGQRLGVSTGTARKYVSSLLSRFGVRRRVDLVRISLSAKQDGWRCSESCQHESPW